MSGIVSTTLSTELLRLAWSSVAALAIAPSQDLLNLGAEARMNLPESAAAQWRCSDETLHSATFHRLRGGTATLNRLHVSQREPTANAVGSVT